MPPSQTATEPNSTNHTVRSYCPASGMTKQSTTVVAPNPNEDQPKKRAQPIPSAAPWP